MILRRILLPVLIAVTILGMLIWGNIPAGIRAVESLVRPVFHKDVINYYAGIYKEDPLFIIAMIKVESKFARKAISPRGAIGLMQIMPKTGQEIAQELGLNEFSNKSLEDPETNIRFGYHYVAKLRKEFGDRNIDVLAAYNGGRNNVKKWIKESGKETLEIKDIEFPETRNFVHDVLYSYRWLKHIQKLRNKLMNLRNEP